MLTLRKLIIVLVFVVSILAISYTGNSQSDRMKDGFYLGPINFFWLPILNDGMKMHYYDSLHYNFMHSFSSHADTTINELINKWNAFSQQNSLIFERERVLRPAYGQRSTYQAEYDGGYWASVFPSYGYYNNNKIQMTGEDYTDNSTFGNGAIVKRCRVNSHNQCLMVKGLIENCEQVNRNDIITTNRSDKKVQKDFFNYKCVHQKVLREIKILIFISNAFL